MIGWQTFRPSLEITMTQSLPKLGFVMRLGQCHRLGLWPVSSSRPNSVIENDTARNFATYGSEPPAHHCVNGSSNRLPLGCAVATSNLPPTHIVIVMFHAPALAQRINPSEAFDGGVDESVQGVGIGEVADVVDGVASRQKAGEAGADADDDVVGVADGVTLPATEVRFQSAHGRVHFRIAGSTCAVPQDRGRGTDPERRRLT